MSTLQQTQIDDLDTRFQGDLLVPGDVAYEEMRQVWNAMIDRKPALIARCTSAGDVVQALAFSRRHNLIVAIRGGGHNIAGSGVCDNGVVIDLSRMKSVTVDAQTRRAIVGPGATLADFDAAAQAHGLATPLGINSTTGVAGLTLGGGFGWLSRKYGMTVDNLLAADVVTAEGRQVRTSASENADLFWGLRGGGGNFGIVTSFEFQLHPVGPSVLSGLIVFPFDQAKSVLTQFARFTQSMPDDLNVWAIVRKAPPLPFLPPEIHGTPIVVLALCYVGDPARGDELIDRLRRFATPHGELIGWQPYAAWQQALDPLLTRGARNYWKSHNFSRLGAGAIDTIVSFAARLPSPQCEIIVATLGGQTTRVAPEAMAYANRDASYVMNVHARWDSAGDDERCIAWARDFFTMSRPFASGGAYINFLTQDEADRVAFAYGASYKRLVQLKNKYDPTNVFRMNPNIRPA